MSQFIFIFDLDSTITKEEILPTIAQKVGRREKMSCLTESTMKGEIPFKQSFLQRVEMLKDIPVSEISHMISEIKLNEELTRFIKKYKERCYILTGNLDVWIKDLIRKIDMEEHLFSSKALVNDDYIHSVFSVIDKNAVISQLVLPFVAVGDGNNDAEMIERAEVGIGYGGVREIAPSIMACATHVVYDEYKLVNFLERLV